MINGIGNGTMQYGAYAGSYAGSSMGAKTVRTPAGQEIAENSAQAKALKRSGAIECKTCKSRQYQDGSNESDVSFKAPGHISPQGSIAAVRAHEQQHVSNAYQKEAKGAKVVSASVKIDMEVCPECGRSYAAGGQTRTAIKYNEKNPYEKNNKSRDAATGAIGGNFDEAV